MSDEIPFRVGQAFDVHAFSDDPDRVLVLGGVRFDDAPGLAGHSDADVVAHACTDGAVSSPMPISRIDVIDSRSEPKSE